MIDRRWPIVYEVFYVVIIFPFLFFFFVLQYVFHHKMGGGQKATFFQLFCNFFVADFDFTAKLNCEVNLEIFGEKTTPRTSTEPRESVIPVFRARLKKENPKSAIFGFFPKNSQKVNTTRDKASTDSLLRKSRALVLAKKENFRESSRI